MYPVSPLWPEPPSAPAILSTNCTRLGFENIDNELRVEVPIYWETRHFDEMIAHVWLPSAAGIKRVMVPMDLFVNGSPQEIEKHIRAGLK